jgi:hypothetical protein
MFFDFSNARLSAVAIHKIGNKANEEPLILSKSLLDLQDEDLRKLLKSYFTGAFKEAMQYQFTHPAELDLNEMYQVSGAILEGETGFFAGSLNIGQILYDRTNRPNIKSGELYVVHFEECVLDEEVIDAIGIFKSENKETFLKVYPGESGFGLEAEEGVNINKLDKGAIIFNTNQEDGYIVSIVDRTNKNQEAKYWKDDFLKVKPLEDEYYTTNQYLDMVKNFAIEGHPADDKSEKVDLLNRTVGYFKEKETFDEDEFQEIVLQAPETREAFDNYKSHYASTHEMDGFQDEFEISSPAVKQAKRGIRSVIKLDKNFHLYVHGKRDLIERGYDPEKGLNYYKVFFEHEQ